MCSTDFTFPFSWESCKEERPTFDTTYFQKDAKSKGRKDGIYFRERKQPTYLPCLLVLVCISPIFYLDPILKPTRALTAALGYDDPPCERMSNTHFHQERSDHLFINANQVEETLINN
mmetsp:Transcript_11284/g.13674  ORF Transcript_11284/g.13674 Transcript_11284/m.13674 type:complete len:118 (+) Transcript_11284:302-655(+)